ncbi:hypothetical protein [Haloterrigena salinisoli]|uniref:hypothetical protein n=1 Tax=Haloterrigena salinisoli TaxID=3132747 RepID=UPI0030D32506
MAVADVADMEVVLAVDNAVFVEQPLEAKIVFREGDAGGVLVSLSEFVQRHETGGNPPWYEVW